MRGGIHPVTRAAVLRRDGWRCQWCGEQLDPIDYSLQHRRARGMGGSNRVSTDQSANLVSVCGSGTSGCHGHIESHRDAARGRGFTLWQGEDPSAALLIDYNKMPWLFDDLGGRALPRSDRDG